MLPSSIDDALTDLNVPQPVRPFIGGSWGTTSGREIAHLTNPYSGATVARIYQGAANDVAAAVEKFGDNGRAWSSTSPRERGDVLREAARRIRLHRHALAYLDTLQSGLPISSMLADVESAAQALEYTAGLVHELKGVVLQPASGRLAGTVRKPYGVVGRILAYNHPLKFAAGKAAAPLAAGNALILKPADTVPLSALGFAALVEDLLPPGTLSVIPGPGQQVGSAISEHPGVPRVALIGSPTSGARVLASCAPLIKHVTLELGGKNPLVVNHDVEPSEAARHIVRGMNLTKTMGQSCQAKSRLFIHEERFESVLVALHELCAELVSGNPLDEEVSFGPIAFAAQFQKVEGLISEAESDGLDVRKIPPRGPGPGTGMFVNPCVVVDPPLNHRIASEEIFGPVMSAHRWRDEDQMVADVNASPYGLSGSVLAADAAEAFRIGHRLEVGNLIINAGGGKPQGLPFGGVKMSGLGQEDALDEILSYTSVQSWQIAGAS